MPQLDKSGPRGQGSQTGKKRGNCNNQETNNAEFGSWRKAGRGKGKGLQGRMNRSAEVELDGANGAGWGRGQRCRMQQNRNSQLQ